MQKVKFPNPDTDAAKVLAALVWARKELRLSDVSKGQIIFAGTIAGFELARICGDYRSRISQLRAKGFTISMALDHYQDERGGIKRAGVYRLEFPWPLSPAEIASLFPNEALKPDHMVQFQSPKGMTRTSDHVRGDRALERKSAGVPKLPKAVREFCLKCVESVGEVRRCKIFKCDLWLFRFGRNPTSGEIEEWTEAKALKKEGVDHG